MSDPLPQTVFFGACRAVFEGGGCRAAAHAGALQAALRAGINFSEVAGTSGGSIVAALLGAGAPPDYVNEQLSGLDFKRFLKRPEETELQAARLLRATSRLFLAPGLKRSEWLRHVGTILRYGGLYSSAAIEEWVDARLADLLPDAPRPIEFRHLLIPTRIVATDLAAGTARIWGSKETPGERVAFAVRCSCSIPGFFQPVQSGVNRFVDGGVLSNLPTFVYSEHLAGRRGSMGGPILAFRLEDELNPPTDWSLSTLAQRLLATMIGGATELQIAVQGDVHVVSIPTAGVAATDFEKMTSGAVARLREAGEKETLDFVRREAAVLRSKPRAEISSWDLDELYDTVVRATHEPMREVFIAAEDTIFFWRLFPSVLRWTSSGARLNVLVLPITASGEQAARERQRRSLLDKMGAQVVEAGSLPIRGYFLSRVDSNRDAAIVVHETKSEHAPLATAYLGSRHREVIQAARSLVQGHFGAQPLPKVSLRPHGFEGIVTRMRQGVGQYSVPEVRITLEEVPLARVDLLTRLVRAYKYRQIVDLAAIYGTRGIPLFEPAAVVANGQELSVTTPPVVEQWGDRFVAIDGNTRAFFGHRQGLERLTCLVVRGQRDPLPGVPTEARRAVLSTRRHDPGERIEGFDYSMFRSIEGSVRPLEGF